MKLNQKLRLSSFKFGFVIATLCALIYSSCNKPGNNSAGESNVKATYNKEGLLKNHLKTETELNSSSYVLKNLFQSPAWKSIPQKVLQTIKNLDKPTLQTYDNMDVKTINFDIAGNDPNILYKSLIIYVYEGKFLPVIIQSQQMSSGFTNVSIKDLNEEDYFHLDVDKNEKFGKFKIEKDIPWEKITLVSKADSVNYSSKRKIFLVQQPDDRTCMQKNTTFKGCMTCAINECDADFVCYIGCGVNFVPCMAVFAASCVFHADPPTAS